MKLFAYSLIFLALAWVSPKTQASSVSKIGTTISFCKAAQISFLAQDTEGGGTTGSQTGEGGGGGMEKIQQALFSGGGSDAEGVFDVGLSWLRGLTIMFLGLYGVYLGVSLAFGQADGAGIARLFFGAMMALGAQTVSTLYTVLFSGEGGQ